MHIDKYTPPDIEEAKQEKYKTPSFRYGICGLAVIATLSHKSIKEILSIWSSEFKGHAPMKEVENTLLKLGYSFRKCRGMKAKKFPIPRTNSTIIRIQWLQGDGTEYYWAKAPAYTHYVLMQKIDGKWWVFCDSEGWFEIDETKEHSEYLKRNQGYVSSYLEIADNPIPPLSKDRGILGGI